MQHTLQTDLANAIRDTITEWLEDNGTATADTMNRAAIDALADYQDRTPQAARDAADERGDWLLEQRREAMARFGQPWGFMP